MSDESALLWDDNIPHKPHRWSMILSGRVASPKYEQNERCCEQGEATNDLSEIRMAQGQGSYMLCNFHLNNTKFAKGCWDESPGSIEVKLFPTLPTSVFLDVSALTLPLRNNWICAQSRPLSMSCALRLCTISPRCFTPCVCCAGRWRRRSSPARRSSPRRSSRSPSTSATSAASRRCRHKAPPCRYTTP